MIPIIATRSYELVRNRIAQILATELPNQATLHSDAGLNADVFIDRIVPLHDEEMPLINIVMGSGNWDNFTRFKQDGTYSYNIDIYTKSSGTSTEMGDVLSMNKLQKLAGVVQGILMHPQYITLSFAAPFIEHTEVNSITMGIPNNTLDASNVTQARLTFVVRVPESETANTPLDIAGWSTQVKLGLTDKGYIYSGDNIPIPDPVCEVLTFVYNSDNTLLVSKTVSDTDNVIVAPDITVTDSDGTTYNSPSGVDVVCTASGGTAIVTNSNATYNNTVDGGDTLVLADVNNVDSDGTIVPTPAMIPFVCTLQDNTITASLPFIGTDDTCKTMFQSAGVTTYSTLINSSNIGALTYSTDGITYSAFSLPFTPIVSTAYWFKRSSNTTTGNYTISD